MKKGMDKHVQSTHIHTHKNLKKKKKKVLGERRDEH